MFIKVAIFSFKLRRVIMKLKTLSVLSVAMLLVVAGCTPTKTSSTETSTEPATTTTEPTTTTEKTPEELAKEKVLPLIADLTTNWTIYGGADLMMNKSIQTENYYLYSLEFFGTAETYGEIKLSDGNWYAYTIGDLEDPSTLKIEPGAIEHVEYDLTLTADDLSGYDETHDAVKIANADYIDMMIGVLGWGFMTHADINYMSLAAVDGALKLYFNVYTDEEAGDYIETYDIYDIGTSSVPMLDEYSANGAVPTLTALGQWSEDKFGGLTLNYTNVATVTSNLYAASFAGETPTYDPESDPLETETSTTRVTADENALNINDETIAINTDTGLTIYELQLGGGYSQETVEGYNYVDYYYTLSVLAENSSSFEATDTDGVYTCSSSAALSIILGAAYWNLQGFSVMSAQFVLDAELNTLTIDIVAGAYVYLDETETSIGYQEITVHTDVTEVGTTVVDTSAVS